MSGVTGEGRVPHPQARVAALLAVRRRAAPVLLEEPAQAVLRRPRGPPRGRGRAAAGRRRRPRRSGGRARRRSGARRRRRRRWDGGRAGGWLGHRPHHPPLTAAPATGRLRLATAFGTMGRGRPIWSPHAHAGRTAPGTNARSSTWLSSVPRRPTGRARSWRARARSSSSRPRPGASRSTGRPAPSKPNGKTSPEELIAAAHSTCFSMALSHGLAGAGHAPTSIDTTADVTFQAGEGITGHQADRGRRRPRHHRRGVRRGRPGRQEELPGLPGPQAVPITLEVSFKG